MLYRSARHQVRCHLVRTLRQLGVAETPCGPLQDPVDGVQYPNALENWLTGVVARAQEDGDVDPDRDARTEVVVLLALTNGLVSSVLGTQRTAEQAAEVLRYTLDRLFPRGGR